MQKSVISSEELNEQIKFHSFILCQTKCIPLSQKLPFIVTTQKGKITKSALNQVPEEDFECNYAFNCVNYKINGRNIILGEGNWMKALLSPKEVHHLQTYQILNFESLELKKQVNFYFYNQNDKIFIEMKPKYLMDQDGLIFEDVEHIQDAKFKTICIGQIEKMSKKMLNEKKVSSFESFRFESEYAIMSDMHFLGSLIRGQKKIGSYLKNRLQKSYVHIIDNKLLQNLKRLYPSSNL